MERQLKERLIGAAVLVAVAVVLVPEMFSGSASRVASATQTAAVNLAAETDSSTSSGQLKTFHIQLQDRDIATAPVAAPAASSAAAAETSEPDASAPTAAATNAESLAMNNSSASASSASPSTTAAKGNVLKGSISVASNVATSKPSEAVSVKAEPINKPAPTDAKGWVVQIGSFSAEAKAKQIAASLKAKDYPAYSGPVTAKGKTLFRVRVGPLAERAAADELLKRLKGEYRDASVVPQGR